MANNPSEVKKWTIYKITNPIGQVYVGCSSNFPRRIKRYRYRETDSQPLIHASIGKYGFENHLIEIIETFESSVDYAEGKEIFWIRTYMSNKNKWPDLNGLNLSDGGRSALGVKMSAEARQKMKDKKAHKSIPVLQYDLEGNFIKEYSSISEAAKKTGSRVHLIRYVARGVYKKTNNYIFKYK